METSPWQTISTEEDDRKRTSSSTSVMQVTGGHLFRVSTQMDTTKGVSCTETLCFVPDAAAADEDYEERAEPDPDPQAS